MKEYLYSYGTLQKDRVQLELFRRLLVGAKDILKGYKTCPIEIEDESFLSKGKKKNQLTAIFSDDAKDTIEGTVFEVSEEELLLADKYEPEGYERVEVTLESGKRAWVYLAA
jgi:Gamma-glutamyl cyclotransferase, AIG2-like